MSGAAAGSGRRAPEGAGAAPSPEELARAARDGDEKAMGELLRRARPRAFRWALARTGDPDEADEVAQRVLIRLHRYLDGFAGRSAFHTWLYRITANTAATVRREREPEDAAGGPLPDPGGPEDPTRGSDDPVARLYATRLADLVRVYFRELPPRQREVFQLAELEGRAPAEIAEMLEMKPVTVRANLFKARRRIRERIVEHHPELEEGYGR